LLVPAYAFVNNPGYLSEVPARHSSQAEAAVKNSFLEISRENPPENEQYQLAQAGFNPWARRRSFIFQPLPLGPTRVPPDAADSNCLLPAVCFPPFTARESSQTGRQG
jgi:hypothetical protein